MSRRKKMKEKRRKTRAEREERSTVMRSQMLLISCAAVRVPAIATMSHSSGKQRERLRNREVACHLPAFTSAAR